jgi:multidrug resistance efflux pump
MDFRRYMSQIGKKGGKARAAKLTPERRKEIAIKGAIARNNLEKARKTLDSQAGTINGSVRYDEPKQSLQ